MRAIYEQKLSERRAAAARLDKRDAWLADMRLAVFLMALGLGLAAFFLHRLAWLWLVLPAVLFVGLVVLHELTRRALTRAQRAVRFYERGLRRLDEQWDDAPRDGSRFVDAGHPYSGDLDLFGKGSLFQLLATVETTSGESVLADYLLSAPPLTESRARQEAVRELAQRLILREDLFVLGGETDGAVRPDGLVKWGEAPPAFAKPGVVVPFVFLSVLGALTLLGWAVLGTGALPIALQLVIMAIATRLVRDPMEQVLGGVEAPALELRVLAKLIDRFAVESASSAKLAELRATLVEGDVAAARAVRRLARLLDLADARRNQLFAIPAFILGWGPLSALAVEAWRRRHGAAVRRWLRGLGELEALLALSGYHAEHPDDVFPELVDDGPRFVAHGLTHALLPRARAVRNDVALGDPLRLYLVSGSNMSGKSTLLRSVGVATVMAYAGAPVRAKQLVLSSFAVGATLRIQDSLAGGASRFYAEVLRLKALMDLARGPRPLLFLLDEILHGTNSHDRQAGAAAVVRALLDLGAVGFVTTHDLALTHFADELGSRAVNVHFEDELEGDRLVFDYRMRPGVVEKRNAIALMRAAGLPVA